MTRELPPGSGMDIQSQKKVSQAFLKQLEDQSVEVQGNAVKCLAKIVLILVGSRRAVQNHVRKY